MLRPMTRRAILAACQMGPLHRADGRAVVLARMVALLEKAARMGAEVAVFPELALTTFFPRWYLQDQDELHSYYEHSMPNASTQPLFDLARELGIGFYLGYAELANDGGQIGQYNTSILVDKAGQIIGKYRKIHLPGTVEPRVGDRFQQLEKRYFEYGDLGFPAFRGPESWGRPVLGMLICNDRRWPETYRVMALQGAEVIVLGYNTPSVNIHWNEPVHLRTSTHLISLQANAYQNRKVDNKNNQF